MKIGVPKEIKTHEYRVGLTPDAVRELCVHGHAVIVERDAAAAIGFSDDVYRAAGAAVVATAAEVFAAADMVVKVKEPQPGEIALLRPGQILFTYLHLAADKAQTEGLMRSGATCIAYETVTDSRGALPLLSPMSEVAGRMSVQVGAHCLEKEQGGAGVLLGGVPGVPAGKVVVLGGGVSGTNAARMAIGIGADVTVIDRSIARLKELDQQFAAQMHTVFSTTAAIEQAVIEADLVIGAVLVPGAAAPKLVSRAMVRRMRPGSTSPSTRAAASKPAAPPPMPPPPMWRKAWCITASATCPARSPAPPPSPWATRPCPSCSHWPTRAGARPWPTTRICATA